MAEALNQVGAENITVSTAAIALSGVANLKPTRVLIYVGAQPIRWRSDGNDPTSTTGMYVAAGNYLDFTNIFVNYRSVIDRIKFIRDTSASGDATLAVAYFG